MIKTLINKVKNFYIWLFTKIIQTFRAIVAYNKWLLADIKADFSNKSYVFGIIKSICYCAFFLVQLIMFLLVLTTYVMCKLTGICLII